MDELSRWITAYEGMDERRRMESLALAEATALAHPAKKAAKLTLADNLSKLIAAHRGMDEDGRRFILSLAERKAERYRARSVPRLRVVDDSGAAYSASASEAISTTESVRLRLVFGSSAPRAVASRTIPHPGGTA